MNSNDAQDLMRVAEEFSKRSYAPYSGFKVGAAARTDSGKIYGGTSIEIASYGLSICAETVAIAKAVSEGETIIKALAIFSDGGDGSPCGGCRQFMSEFGSEILVYFSRNGKIVEIGSEKLLPSAFPTERKSFNSS